MTITLIANLIKIASKKGKLQLFKAMFFQVVLYGCESWTIKMSAREFMFSNRGAGED